MREKKHYIIWGIADNALKNWGEKEKGKGMEGSIMRWVLNGKRKLEVQNGFSFWLAMLRLAAFGMDPT